MVLLSQILVNQIGDIFDGNQPFVDGYRLLGDDEPLAAVVLSADTQLMLSHRQSVGRNGKVKMLLVTCTLFIVTTGENMPFELS